MCFPQRDWTAAAAGRQFRIWRTSSGKRRCPPPKRATTRGDRQEIQDFFFSQKKGNQPCDSASATRLMKTLVPPLTPPAQFRKNGYLLQRRHGDKSLPSTNCWKRTEERLNLVFYLWILFVVDATIARLLIGSVIAANQLRLCGHSLAGHEEQRGQQRNDTHHPHADRTLCAAERFDFLPR